MRLTIRLHAGMKDVTIRRWNKVWKTRGKFYDYPPVIPQALADKGITVVEVNKQQDEPEEWTPPRPDDPRYARVVPPEEQPDWQTEPAYTHKGNVRLFEGIKQACLIANAQHFDGFPSSVEKLIGAVKLQDQDMLVQRSIMQAQQWNTDETKLPKPFDPSKPRWSWKRQFGITHHKSSEILLRNLLRLCQSQVTQFPSLASRVKILDPFVYSYVYHKGKPVVMKENLDIVLTSKTPLPPFAGEDVVDASVTHKLPDMWPVFPTVDFLETNNYELCNVTGCPESHPVQPHTIVQIPQKLHWETPHYQAGQIMSCLMYTAALARKRFGDDVKILPEPISIQHIHLERNRILFTFFQLNTLDLDTETGIKNLVWTSGDERLYNILAAKPWMKRELKIERYDSYDPEVFEKFLAVYLNGISEQVAPSVDIGEDKIRNTS